MFGKKMVVGFLVDDDRKLLKEFLFHPKAEVTYDDVLKVTEGKGDLPALGAFEVDKYVGNVVAGKDMHFIIISRDVAEEDELLPPPQPGPPPEAFSACAELEEGAPCTVQPGGKVIEGTCRSGPEEGAALACVPKGPPPGHHRPPPGPPRTRRRPCRKW